MMEILETINVMKKLQEYLLNLIDNDENIEENSENLLSFIKNNKINEDKFDLKNFLYLLSNIVNNHQRSLNFFQKIESILLFLKDEIKANFSNIDIFHIFRKCKRILLFLIEEKFIVIDESLVSKMLNEKYVKMNYQEYLFPEISNYLTKDQIKSIYEKNTDIFGIIKSNEEGKEIKEKIDEDNNNNESKIADDDNNNFDIYIKDMDEFKKRRQIGENCDYLCYLIREDLIEEFLIYVNRNDCDLKSPMKTSIYETNIFLIKENSVYLFEYAAFFGSTQIFKYFYKNNFNLTPKIWLYAIHSENPEMIDFLVQNRIKPNSNTYFDCLKESLKCHHNSVMEYIKTNLIDEKDIMKKKCKCKNKKGKTITLFEKYSIKYHNYSYFPLNYKNNLVFLYYLCQYDYYKLVKIQVSNSMKDIIDKLEKINIYNFFIIKHFILQHKKTI